jgi:hypothetical protein
MKVDIRQKEQKSLFGKVKGYSVYVEVAFSEEEKAIIRQKKIEKIGAFEINDKTMGKFVVSIKDLMKQSWGNTFDTPIEASHFTKYLKDKIKELKEFIDDNAYVKENTSESFEL